MPLLASVIAGGAIITPIVIVLVKSLSTGKLGAYVGFTLANYLRVFGDRDILPLLNNSILYAAGSALLGTGRRGATCLDCRANQYSWKDAGRADAALSDPDAADYEKHRLDSAPGAKIRHSQ